MGDEIGEGFGAAASEGDIDESGYDADEDAVQDELGSEAAADPDGEGKTGEERGGRCGVGEGRPLGRMAFRRRIIQCSG